MEKGIRKKFFLPKTEENERTVSCLIEPFEPFPPLQSTLHWHTYHNGEVKPVQVPVASFYHLYNAACLKIEQTTLRDNQCCGSIISQPKLSTSSADIMRHRIKKIYKI